MRHWWLMVFAVVVFCLGCDTYSPRGNDQPRPARYLHQRTITDTWLERSDEKQEEWPW